MPDSDKQGYFLATLPATAFDRKLAWAAVGISSLFFLLAVPFAGMKLPEMPAFVAGYQFSLAIIDLITVILLLVQFGILRSRSLLLLASGYLFTAIIAVVHALTFPGLFSPTGLLGADRQTTVWLYMFWHAGFPLLTIGYALQKGPDGGPRIRGSAPVAITRSIVAVIAAVAALTWVTTGAHDILPTLLREGRYTPAMIAVVSSVWCFSLGALLVLWRRRPHSVLDIWLMVVLCAWLFDIALSAILNVARFDLGFYVGRLYGLLAACFVLAVLLVETSVLQAQLARLLALVRQHAAAERDRHDDRERLFSAVVESSNDAIITKTLDGTITAWNPAAERLFGYSAPEAVGKRIDIIIPADRHGEMRDILDRVGRGERIEHHETRRLRRDGTELDITLGVSPIRSASGAIVGASKTARDVTEARKTQRALNQEIEERRRIFESSQDLILVTDAKGHLVQVSPSSEAILGHLPDAMVGRDAAAFIQADDLAPTRAEMQATIGGRQMRDFEARLVHRDGRLVPLTWMGTWSEPVQRHFLVGRDMTSSRQAQEALLESEQLAHGIVDTALDAFVQMDEAGTVIDWNRQAERIFGWPRQDVLGRTLGDLIIPPVHREAHRNGLARFLQTGKGQILGRRLQLDALRRNGEEIKVELSITALKRRQGFVFNGFIRDVTEQIAAEERFRQAQKMDAVGQLTGGIAHDFNNILTVITGTIEILAEAVATEPELATIARMIDEAAGRGAELTQHLLAFARRQPLQPRETDINALIVETSKLLRPTLGEHIEIELAFDEATCLALIDPTQLATAMLNLALNARDAMPGGGKLVLETGSAYLDEAYASRHSEVRAGPYVLIAVSDTGTGIPAELLDKVFDPFFTSKGPGKGTGLGLSMVYGFVKQSSGHIKIYSEEGHGTTVKIYLPPAAGLPANSEPAQVAATSGGNETILVVEDDPLVRDYVVTQLQRLGYVTLASANATEALAVIETGRAIDLLFTDVIMPGPMNGRQLADEVLRRRPGCKVLFTSGYTENAIIHHGRLDPGVLLLAKPYRKSDLARMLRLALGSTG
ncbi:MAG: PAS domain S-box protein [Rhizobiales bacterium]|nr:PAS domain S-box protein [Hyphomicrobiales bacterium]